MYPTDRITHTTAFVTPVVEHGLEICLITYKLYYSYFLPSKLGVTVLFVYRLYRQLLHEPDDVRLSAVSLYIYFNLIGCQTVDFQLWMTIKFEPCYIFYALYYNHFLPAKSSIRVLCVFVDFYHVLFYKTT